MKPLLKLIGIVLLILAAAYASYSVFGSQAGTLSLETTYIQIDNEGSSLDELAARLKASLTPGSIVRGIPSAVNRDESVKATVTVVRLGIDKVLEAMGEDDTIGRDASIESLTTAYRMYVDLYSPDDAFTIRRLSPADRYQIIELLGNATWIFSVTGKVSGSHELVVEAGVTAETGDGDASVTYATYAHIVNVEVTGPSWLAEIWREYFWPLVLGIGSVVAAGLFAFAQGLGKNFADRSTKKLPLVDSKAKPAPLSPDPDREAQKTDDNGTANQQQKHQ